MRKRLLLLLTFMVLTSAISGCDSGLEVKDISISKYPEKMVYIIGKDTALDLAGCEIEVITKDGTRKIEKLDNESTRNLYIIQEEINFNKEGVYRVDISRHQSFCSFAVRVVSSNKD